MFNGGLYEMGADPEATDIWKFGKAAGKSDEQIDAELKAHQNRKLPQILDAICEAFPDRAEKIRKGLA
jgi:hypothetical protein